MAGEKLKINRIPSGEVRAPASKSVGHRALICAALAGGEKALGGIKNLGVSEDITATRLALAALLDKDGNLTDGPGGEIDCGESGSTLRFLLPLAGLDGRERIFTGRGRLMQRPLDIYKEVFESHGGLFRQEDDRVIVCGPLSPGRYELPGDVSSQFISGLLFALPLLDGESEIVLTSQLESADYVNLTVDVMETFGVRVDVPFDSPDEAFRIPGNQRYRPVKYTVEGDWSQAAVFLCAGALGAPVSVGGLDPGSMQGDMRILRILKSMGADADVRIPMLRKRDATVRALAPREGLRGVNVDVRDIPDLVPPLAALACFASGETRFTNAGRLRLKESDRIEALVTELGKLGADLRAEGDDIIIKGRKYVDGGEADARGDHRIAMAVAVCSVRCTSPVYLTGAEHVAKSYPAFWDDFLRAENTTMEEGLT
ncbi:MAG: 3-phosphoshikimate 1-carboxyvinyltransferase [Clostridiales Family XIII bacterium]|jgi:3-phosphoshikimate 1-carboxyvinyltransferase|nr:3-phosphoshikimate 1-carboxyvinyltransferase [Clostridiales Family XIII bacterium]